MRPASDYYYTITACTAPATIPATDHHTTTATTATPKTSPPLLLLPLLVQRYHYCIATATTTVATTTTTTTTTPAATTTITTTYLYLSMLNVPITLLPNTTSTLPATNGAEADGAGQVTVVRLPRVPVRVAAVVDDAGVLNLRGCVIE